MNYNKKTVRDVDVTGKKILLRCDFNVPHDNHTGVIQDVTRIAESIPTLKYLLEQKAAVIICSHLGRPKGTWNPALSLASAAGCLQSMLGIPVPLTRDILGEDTKTLTAKLQPGEAMLIENLRFRKEEEANDDAFSKDLASLAELFVFDAFGASHRAHASTAGVANHLPSVAGILVEKELEVMGDALEHPKRPFSAVLGGSKVSDKIGVIRRLLDIADNILIGGGMAYTFLAADGHEVGDSLIEKDRIDFAREMLALAREKRVPFLLPTDHLAATEFSSDADPILVESTSIPEGLMGLDIGPETTARYAKALEESGTVIWNGPMGVFEFPAFSKGTHAVAEVLASLPDAITIIGGGDSASAVDQIGLADQMTHISTGGGAALEFMEGLDLPGISHLLDKE